MEANKISNQEINNIALISEGQSRENLERFSIQNCLDHFMSVERLTGSNKIGCEDCTLRANMVGSN